MNTLDLIAYNHSDCYIDKDEYISECVEFPSLKRLSAKCVNDNKIPWWSESVLPPDDVIQILVDNMWSPLEHCYIVPNPFIWHRIGKFIKRHPKHEISFFKPTYKRYTNFDISMIEETFTGVWNPPVSYNYSDYSESSEEESEEDY